MRLVIEAFGENVMSRKLIRMATRSEDLGPVFNEIRTDFYDLEQQQFDTEGGFSGGWAPLADSTIAAKEKLGIDLRILHGPTGDLESSLTDSGDPNAVFRMTKDTLTMGSSISYGVFHQSLSARSRLPRRPLVAIPENRKRQWMRMLQHYLVGGA